MNRKKLRFWLFVGPVLVLFLNVVIVPFLIGIYYAFTNWDGFGIRGASFVGLNNFARAIFDTQFQESFLLSIRFTALNVVTVNLFGFLLALLVTRNIHSKHFIRTVFFLPNLIGGLILGFVWQFIFTNAFANINQGILFDWLQNPQSALYALVLVSSWKMAGYAMVIYVAAIEGIPNELLEASKIAGANFLQRIWHIIIPMTIPAFTVNMFLAITDGFKQYEINLALTNGGPQGSTRLVAMDIFNTAFAYREYAVAQAKAILFFVTICVIAITQVYITKKREVEL